MRPCFLKVLTAFFLFCGVINAQKDTLLPLTYNPGQIIPSSASAKITSLSANAISLPFFDDFAYAGPAPDPNKWESNSAVFVNPGFPRTPFTIGAATFDGLNIYGYPYNAAAGGGTTAPADTLTSLPIDLSIFSAGDTGVYLSFFYQPRGWGETPETQDSLVLQFYRSSDSTWSNAWARAGFNPGANDSSWNYVMVRVDDAGYFNNQFKFRFKNRACPCGSNDHWHIDYIYLNGGRNLTDTIFKDIAFGYQAPSLLKNYSSMPYWAVSAQDIALTYPVFIRNNNYQSQQEAFWVPFDVYDQNNNVTNISVGAPNSIDNFLVGGWDDYAPHVNQSLSSLPTPVLNDTGTYKTKLYIVGGTVDAYDENINDTLHGITHFYNYYSYDDGTAEAGYGLQNYPGAQMAVQFTINAPDTLRAMDIFFNPVISVPTIQNSSYELWVWDNNGGIPGNAIYTQGSIYPTFATNIAPNTFKRDTLSTPLALNAGTYYIGIKQTSSQALNVGFDRNYDHQDKMFYNTSGSWNNSSFEGSYMIRPVMRILDLAQGISDNLLSPRNHVLVYPNPTNEKFTVSHSSIKNGDLLTAEIFDFSGRLLLTEKVYNNDEIDIASLSNGVYILKISDKKSVIHTTKLFVAH